MRSLERIYLALGGDLAILASGRLNPLRNDLVHEASGTHVEVDEMQHFTSFRLATLGGAYDDALRDLAGVAMGQRPLLRIAAPEADAVMAYARARGVLLDMLGG